MADVFDDEVEGEPTISIKDYLEAVEEEELEADLVLGGDEGKECTYSKGYMKRQAIFSCLTCTPDGNAGVCTACSLSCHEGHEIALMPACYFKDYYLLSYLIELHWLLNALTIPSFFCKLLASKDVENPNNVYNHNFKGTYCTCDLPYPNPDAEEQEEMIQCCICEDWFHEEHIGLQSSDKLISLEILVPKMLSLLCLVISIWLCTCSWLIGIPRDESGEPLYEDFICQRCAMVCSFLSYYPQPISTPDLSSSGKEKAVLEIDPPAISSGKLENENCSLDTNISNANSDTVSAEAKPDVKVNECTEVAGASTKCIIGTDLAENPPTIDKSKPMFLTKNWRESLCRCEKCFDFYAQKGIGFLVDKEDSIAEYERMAKQKRNENLQKQEGVEQNFLNNLGHVAKMEILSGIADMKNEFCSFLQSNDPSKPITTADVQQVFENLAKKRKREL
ncbi:hypothetical protein DH2020_005709 [Rehmannia glutinosa]|uniref:UBR-type domain-containing protein n=1 Tax=Rehmannia glutinosa TaxID=99300 RepID=A0ABR0XGR6_REHGL